MGERGGDCEAKGSPKAGAEPTADGVAETRRIVGVGVGSGAVCSKVDSVRVCSGDCAGEHRGKVLRMLGET